MNILDHRILVPKSPQIVWEVLSDLSRNPTWQVNYSTLSFLTSRHTGTGVRWRYTATNGREYVAETTAWYDGLGYEYTFVDGVQFRENKGRIRLQEIPEGTIVQWTFSYDVGGLLAGVRNAISYKRQVESVMVDSLKMLWRVMNRANDESSREAKSILREGLTYEARAQYKPRHPSIKAEPTPTEPNLPAVVIIEPPLSDDDTRPRAPVVVDTPVVDDKPAETASMTDFQPPAAPDTSIFAPKRSEPASTQEHIKVADQPAVDDGMVVLDPPPMVTPEIQLSTTDSSASDLIKPPGILPEQPIIVEIAPDTPPIIPLAENLATSAEIAADGSEQKSDESISIVDGSKRDTAAVSIFDVFGLPKPSETQEMPVVSIDEPVRAALQTVAVASPKSPRAGLRLMLRRKHVRLRRPG